MCDITIRVVLLSKVEVRVKPFLKSFLKFSSDKIPALDKISEKLLQIKLVKNIKKSSDF